MAAAVCRGPTADSWRAAETWHSLEVAGDDRVFHPASGRIDGATLLVSSPDVKDPVAVRYAWRNMPDANLYNAAGLPRRALPHRSLVNRSSRATMSRHRLRFPPFPAGVLAGASCSAQWRRGRRVAGRDLGGRRAG
ncbi:MAG: hypothetical protein WDM96_04650 [Lacunisphaera sp.]